MRIGGPGYVPNNNDILRARQKSTGITEARFDMGKLRCVLLLVIQILIPT